MELFDSQFPGKNGAAVLFDGSLSTLHHPTLARRRFIPCSTFKLYLALMGLDSGIVRNPAEVWKYTGEKVGQEPGRRSMSLDVALQESSEWYFREVARKLGAARLRTELKRIGYGGGWSGTSPEDAWIDGSLLISPEEQARLAWKLERNALPYASQSQRAVKSALGVSGLTLWGKTGSGRKNSEGLAMGWFVGAYRRGDAVRSFAVLRREPQIIGPEVRESFAMRLNRNSGGPKRTL